MPRAPYDNATGARGLVPNQYNYSKAAPTETLKWRAPRRPTRSSPNFSAPLLLWSLGGPEVYLHFLWGALHFAISPDGPRPRYAANFNCTANQGARMGSKSL